MIKHFQDTFKKSIGDFTREVKEETEGEEFKALKQVLKELDLTSLDSRNGVLISEGGMKKVMRITDSATKRSVAKAVLKYPDADPHVLLRFIHEARITALLEHPNIVPVYQINHSDGEPYFIMKELKGQTFSQVLRNREKYDLTTLLNIFLKVCDAVAYAHSKNIVHLDLKPDNIHVGEFGEVQVMDWGLAKDLCKKDTFDNIEGFDKEAFHTMDGQVKGTIGYMSPEQARAENDRKNQKSDIYSLGAILYHILSGEPPYQNGDLHKTIIKIAAGEYKPLNADAPDALASIVNKALALYQDDRYSSVLELSEDLKRYLAGFAPHAEEAPGWKRLMLFVGRHKKIFMVAASFSFLIVFMTVMFILSLKEKESIANENALQAMKNEQKSNALYKDLLASLDKNSELVDTSVPLAIKESAHHMYSTRFGVAKDLLFEVYSEDIDNAEYWFQLGQLHIGDFQFEEGLSCLKKCLDLPMDQTMKSTVNTLIEIFEDCQLERGNVQGFLDLISQNEKLHHMHQLLAHIFTNIYSNWGLDSDSKVAVLQKSLNAMNKGNLKYKVQKIAGGFDLDFKDCRNLVNVISLAGFPATRLSFENCRNLGALKWLRGGRIKYLNLRNTKAGDYRFLHFLDNLEELVMSDIIMHSVSFRRVKVRRLTMYGAVINLADLYNPEMKELNLCSSKVSNIEQLRNYKSLDKIILPPGEIDQGLINTLKSHNIKTKKCDCNNTNVCTFSDF